MLHSDPKLTDLKLPKEKEDGPPRKRFSRSAVQTGVVEACLKSRNLCPECGARVPPFSRSKDHRVRVEDGGLGTADNLNFTHPYCNSGYKEKKLALQARAGAAVIE